MSNLRSWFTTTRLWLLSLAVFWGSTLLIAFIDYVVSEYGQVHWTSGPDLFPNQELGVVLVVLQLGAAVLLLAAGLRYFSSNKNAFGGLFAIVMVAVTGFISFVLFAFFALWHHAYVMGRSL